MKIAILTITNGVNYGNRLQNYALESILKNIGANVETIKNSTNQYKCKNNLKKIIKIFIVYSYKKLSFLNINYFNLLLKENKFEKFTSIYIKQSKYIINKEDISSEINMNYDYFICGSDQVWNPNFKFNSHIDFLTFCDKHKRIAYAPSFGVSEISKELHKEYKEYLNGIEHLSVREYAGANIIKELTGKDVPVLIDPTLMLSKDKWLSIAKENKFIKNKKYILMYFLGNISYKVKEKINNISKKYDLEIINLMDSKNRSIYTVDPLEFITLINKSQLMCTDSFHGIVFSILMKTNFIIFEREDHNVSMNSRIETLIRTFNIDGRLSNKVKEREIFNMDFKEIDEILDYEREKAYKYLKSALKI